MPKIGILTVFYCSVEYLKYHRKNSQDDWFMPPLKIKQKPVFYKV